MLGFNNSLRAQPFIVEKWPACKFQSCKLVNFIENY